jgi:TatD DNase family protein
MMILVDCHCHLQMKTFRKDIEHVLDRAKKAGVKAIINVGFDTRSSEAAVRLSEEFPALYAAVGIHPHDAKTYESNSLDTLAGFLNQEKVIAIGEIGLDYYRNLSPRNLQKKVFIEQLAFACERALPVILHIRDAYQDVLSILEKKRPEKVVLHCFSGNLADARRALAMGCFLSFGGNITYGGGTLSRAVRQVPLERIVVETDAPYLAPVPHRKKRNEPAFIRYTVERVAGLKDVAVGTVAESTTENAMKLFKVNIDG